VHVMRADVRERYNLEGLWGDAPQVSLTGEVRPVKAKRKSRAKKSASKKAKPVD
ncbi:MAG: Ribosomal silencing factor during starvation, partial [Pedosphaera sp.]|nr:Ribosomal silencing factor during starvation [Pedosphaera sp.]